MSRSSQTKKMERLLKEKKPQKPVLFPLEEMGVEIGKKHIFLWNGFMPKSLQVCQLDATFFKEAKLTNVTCPYCKKGLLRLEEVKPVYSGGMHPVPPIMRHTGNEYSYICSNQECNAHFFGHYQWMWID